MKTLGIAAFYHDSSSAIIIDGIIIAASQEERFTRIKHDAGFPKNSIKSNLQIAGLKAQEINSIVFYEKPFLKFERILETYLAFAPFGFPSFIKALPLWIEEKIFQKSKIIKELIDLGFREDVCKNIFFSDHHLSHAASAFYPSPFEESIVLTMDGVGEWNTTSVFLGKGNRLEKVKEINFPHSLGLLYSAFTYYCGFKVNSGEYKLMGLAPYGKPIYAEKIKNHLIDIKDDGSFKLDLSYFNYCTNLTMTNKKFDLLFDRSFRIQESKIEQVHMDLAASIQSVLEEVVIKICTHVKNIYKLENICLAGGVALNCVANGKIHASNIFKNIWIQPASGDAGGSLGAALELQYGHFKLERKVDVNDSMFGSYLGPSFTNEEVEKYLTNRGAIFSKLEYSEIYSLVSEELENGSAIGWFQGRMEFGPRALGNRSIIADARNPNTQKNLNLKTKFRESFRPFAPAILKEDVSHYFQTTKESPYMLLVSEIRNELKLNNLNDESLFGLEKLQVLRSKFPAITHVDYSARVQTVSSNTNEHFHKLINKFKERTGSSLLVNTSFNVRGEPIVCNPEDAYRCFMGSNIDLLVINNFLLRKEDQPKNLLHDYKNNFKLD